MAEDVVDAPRRGRSPKVVIPDGMVALKGSNCSVDGVQYEADKGVVIVPEAVATILVRNHQFEKL